MLKNEAARESLKEYLRMVAPRYALLIDAPWGAGKTYFVSSVCSDPIFSNRHRYCSLSGVSDVKGFRRALLKGGSEAKLLERVNVATNLLGKAVKLENLGGLARDLIEEKLLEDLPEILVFDDIERSTIPSQELFGLLNDFVEHQEKVVVILTNTEADPQKDEFLRRREKLIGRTIKIVPEIGAALEKFLGDLPDGKGKQFLTEHRDRITLTFEQSGHGNLRLLRNSLRECAVLFDRIDDSFFQAIEPLARFCGTFIAFAMSLARGDISERDILDRGDYKRVLGVDEYENHPLKSMYQRFSGLDIYADNSAVMSEQLAVSIFVDGFVETQKLNLLLRETRQFTVQDANPLWRRILHWHELDWNSLEAIVREAEAYLFGQETILPGPYLQTAFGLLLIAKYGGSEYRYDALTKKIIRRITALGRSGGIPEAEFGRKYGWSFRPDNSFSFGGYGCTPDANFLRIMNSMKDAQDERYLKGLRNIALKLQVKFQHDLEGFISDMSYDSSDSGFYHVPILHVLSADKFSSISLEHLRLGRSETLGKAFAAVAARQSYNGDWPKEMSWFASVKIQLEKKVMRQSSFAKAHLRCFLKLHWKFKSLGEG